MKKDLMKLVGGVLLAAVLLVALAACGGASSGEPLPVPSPTAAPTRIATATPTTGDAATPTRVASSATPGPGAASTSTPASGSPGQVIQVALSEDPYLIVPATLTFQMGKTYILRFKTPKEFHTFTATGLRLDIQVYPGQATEQAVTFNEIGTFKVICVIHEQLGQTGRITITKGP